MAVNVLISVIRKLNIKFLVNNQRDAQILFYVFISIYNSNNRNKHIEENLCITLVIHQESLHDARSTKCKILTQN